MKLLLTFLFFAISVIPGHARLGETIKELKRRYGSPINAEATKEARTDHYSFYWERFILKVTVQEGRSVSEEFTRQDGREFTLPEVREVLAESSSPGSAWTPVDGSTWKQPDRRATWAGRSLLVEEKGLR